MLRPIKVCKYPKLESALLFIPMLTINYIKDLLNALSNVYDGAFLRK